jgi:catechol 2,3-dioxygenase-like lactoylglutathione lyase family enzyme
MKMAPNVLQAVPFFMVRDLAASLRFYVDGLGFAIARRWEPGGKLTWCWLELGRAALMLQEYPADRVPDAEAGSGVCVCFQCDDALELYRGFKARGLTPQQPFVGNAMWVVALRDPDGYKLDFESPAHTAEESLYEG